MTRKEIVEAYQEVARSTAGQIMLADLEARFGYSTRPMFDGDPNWAIFRDGGRSVLAHIGRVIETPADYEQEENYDV